MLTVAPARVELAFLTCPPLDSTKQWTNTKIPGVNRGIFVKKRNGFRLELELCYNHTTQVIRRETLMDLKNLMSHVVKPVNPTTTGVRPAPELAQLSEEDLQQIIGGCAGKVPKKCDMT
jgi:bacteriocin-like protein